MDENVESPIWQERALANTQEKIHSQKRIDMLPEDFEPHSLLEMLDPFDIEEEIGNDFANSLHPESKRILDEINAGLYEEAFKEAQEEHAQLLKLLEEENRPEIP